MLSDEIKLINKPGTLDQSQSPSNVVSSKSGEADSGFRPVGVRIAINQMNSPKVVIEETVVEEHKDSNDYLRVKQFKNESAHIKNDKKSKSKDSKKQNSTFSNYTSSGFKFNQSFKSNSNLSQKARSIQHQKSWRNVQLVEVVKGISQNEAKSHAGVSRSPKDAKSQQSRTNMDFNLIQTVSKQDKAMILQRQLNVSRRFMFMVVHELRNPSDSIQQGLQQAQDLMNTTFDRILQEMQQIIKQRILVKKGSIPSKQRTANKEDLSVRMKNRAFSHQFRKEAPEKEHGSFPQSQGNLQPQNPQKDKRAASMSKLVTIKSNQAIDNTSGKWVNYIINEASAVIRDQSIQQQPSDRCGQIKFSAIPGTQGEIVHMNEVPAAQRHEYPLIGLRDPNPSINLYDPFSQNGQLKKKKQKQPVKKQSDSEQEVIQPRSQRVIKEPINPSGSEISESSSSFDRGQKASPQIEELSNCEFDINSDEIDEIGDLSHAESSVEHKFINVVKATETKENRAILQKSKNLKTNESEIAGFSKGCQVSRVGSNFLDNEELVDFLNHVADSDQVNAFISDFQNYINIMDHLGLAIGHQIVPEQLHMIRHVKPPAQKADASIQVSSKLNHQHNIDLLLPSGMKNKASSSPKPINQSEQLQRKAINQSYIPDSSSYRVQMQKSIFSQVKQQHLKLPSQANLGNNIDSSLANNLPLPQRFLTGLDESGQHIANNFLQPSKSVQNKCQNCKLLCNLHVKHCKKILKLNLMMKTYFQNAISSSMILLGLVNDLLDSAKMDQFDFTLNNETFNLFDVISSAFQVVIFQSEFKRIKLLLSFDVNRPYIFRKLFGDPRRLHQIFVNFLSNSLKFTQQNGFLKIHLNLLEEQVYEARKHANFKRVSSARQINSEIELIEQNVKQVEKYVQLEIIIEDNGIGISKENLEKLFQDYTKIEEHSSLNPCGTGLGLSICKTIIQQMGGKVDVQSELEVGTKFIITLQMRATDHILFHDKAASISQQEKEHLYEKAGAYMFTDDFHKHYQLEEEAGPPEAQEEPQFLKPVDQATEILDSKEMKLNPKRKVYRFISLRAQENSALKQDSISRQLDDFMLQIRQFYGAGQSVISEYSIGRQRTDPQERNPVNLDLKDLKKNKKFQTMEKISLTKLIIDPLVLSLNQHKISCTKKSPSRPRTNLLGQQSESQLGDETLRQIYRSNEIFKDDLRLTDKRGYPLERVQVAANLIRKYKQRKLKVLVANDNLFQLLIITSSFELLSCIGKIDQAANGQEALDLVIQNEQNSPEGEHAYDMIFLDLNMPIKNGFEACQLIQNFYNYHKLKETNEEHLELQWLNDLNIAFQLYINSLQPSNQQHNFSNRADLVMHNSECNQLLNLFRKLYKNLRFKSLDRMKRPLLFAYSALTNEEVKVKAKEAGFDSYIENRLSKGELIEIMHQWVESFAVKFIEENFKNINKIGILKEAIKDLEIKNLTIMDQLSMFSVGQFQVSNAINQSEQSSPLSNYKPSQFKTKHKLARSKELYPDRASSQENFNSEFNQVIIEEDEKDEEGQSPQRKKRRLSRIITPQGPQSAVLQHHNINSILALSQQISRKEDSESSLTDSESEENKSNQQQVQKRVGSKNMPKNPSQFYS